MWSIPGGHVEPEESVLEAASRELEEETGITARPVGIVDLHELVVYEGGRLRYHYFIVDVLMEYVSGEPKPGGDALDARFFKLPVRGVELTPSTRKLLLKLSTLKAKPLIATPQRTVCFNGSCT
jgi:8-oxo-dGTP pyrophosphatase MutT (NUDIX family)